MKILESNSRTPERPDVTVVIVNYNTANLLDRLFKTLAASWGSLTHQVIVVDNASRDDSLEILRTHHPDVVLLENRVNIGFARANNQALPHARGRYVLLLNTDAFMSPDTLTKTVDYMDSHPNCGVLGVKLIGSDGLLQPCCRYFPTPWNVFLVFTGLGRLFPRARLIDDLSWDHASVRECDWVPGCYYLVRREVIDDVGLFDPRYFLYYEEVDHCKVVRQAGWRVVYYPFTRVVHIGGESAKSEGPIDSGRQISTLHVESELLFFRKHYGVIGLFSAAFLAILGDLMKVGAGLFKRQGLGQALTPLSHSRTVLDRFFATRFGTRATR